MSLLVAFALLHCSRREWKAIIPERRRLTFVCIGAAMACGRLKEELPATSDVAKPQALNSASTKSACLCAWLRVGYMAVRH